MVYSNQMISPENLHINNLVQTEMVVLIYLVKMFIYMNNLKKNEAMNLKESKKWYWGGA